MRQTNPASQQHNLVPVNQRKCVGETRKRLARLSVSATSAQAFKPARQSKRATKSRLQAQESAAAQPISVDTSTAAPGDHVVVHYEAKLEDGSVQDASTSRDPLEYVVGEPTVIKGLSDAVAGLSVGQKATRTVTPDAAFGEWRQEMLAEIPAADVKQEIKVGDGLKMSNGLKAVVHKIENGTITIDANKPLAGKTLQLDVELLRLTKAADFERATFGGGCFWGPELLFARVPGVLQTQVGYSQGTVDNATYEDVCSGMTGHNEVVQVTFDPSVVSYRQLLKHFTDGHNPTQKNGQGRDLGSQYRSGIYSHNEQQKQEAKAHLAEIQSSFQEPIATEVEELKNYNMAEDYHQQYLARGGRFGNAQSTQKGCTDPIRCYG